MEERRKKRFQYIYDITILERIRRYDWRSRAAISQSSDLERRG